MSTGSFGAWMFWTMFLTVFAAVVLAPAFRDRRDNLLATTGQHATGRVPGAGCDSDGPGSTSYWVRVQYEHEGRPVVTKVPVSWRDQERYRPCQSIKLTYSRRRPKIARLGEPQQALRRGL